MTQACTYRIEVAACPANPRHFRWMVFRGDHRLDLPGYAYASAWAAGEAARVALHWHLILEPLRSASPPVAEPAIPPLQAAPRRYG